jgi:adenosylcobinamide-phosphate synthase
MNALERSWYADGHVSGMAYASAGVAVTTTAGALLQRAGRAVNQDVAVLSFASYIAIAGGSLCQTAGDVARSLSEHDLQTSRSRLPALVGRDPEGLDEGEIARAVVESVAENTVDAIVAPVFWAIVAGVPGVLGYRAINTLDAMVGHRSPRYARFGWAAARADDVAGWLPARLTAALVTGVRPRRAFDVWKAVRHQAPAHPSPNAGVAEAAFAAALGLQLGGRNRYGDRVEFRPSLGAGRPALVPDIEQAMALCRDVSAALGVACLAAATVIRASGKARRP